MKAQENEEKLRRDLRRMKEMFITYDENLRYQELLGRKTRTQGKTCDCGEEVSRRDNALQEEISRLLGLLQQERASRERAELRAREKEDDLRKEVETLEERNSLMEERCARPSGGASIKGTGGHPRNKNEELTRSPENRRSFIAGRHINVYRSQRTLVRSQVESAKPKLLHTKAKEQLKRDSRTNVASRVKIQSHKEQVERQVQEACQATGGRSSQELTKFQCDDRKSSTPGDQLNLTAAPLQEPLDGNRADVEAHKVQTPEEEQEEVKEQEVDEEKKVAGEAARVAPAPEPPHVGSEPAERSERSLRRRLTGSGGEGQDVPRWDGDKVRAKESEEKLRRELQRMKQMFIAYDGNRDARRDSRCQ
ncbi:hypothetical protein F2P81_011090 [Scophthalmus maximus]|uniref:Uncharacterized protein n=1 Tax=Scophthalmus maximus TaxID=52904 RepID=A0A6A4SUI9_SCOMX|nr:hypothetical protein F2P81_011090 [Scophthalmus maximus]